MANEVDLVPAVGLDEGIYIHAHLLVPVAGSVGRFAMVPKVNGHDGSRQLE